MSGSEEPSGKKKNEDITNEALMEAITGVNRRLDGVPTVDDFNGLELRINGRIGQIERDVSRLKAKKNED